MSDIDLDNLHTADFWDGRYGDSDRVWSGHANQRLVEQAGDLPPGRALDIGCGEGGDAAWLANQGWSVTAVDVSSVAVARAARYVAAALAPQVAARITWQQQDIRSWSPPARSFDLVSMQFIHLPRELLGTVQARLASAVSADGTLLIVNHDPLDLHTTAGRPNFPELYLRADEVAATLDPASWEIEVSEPFPRPFTDHDGNPIVIHDTVVRARRR